MPVRIGTGLSTSPDQRAGALEATLTAREGLDGGPCDLAVVFASGAHLAAPEAVLEAVHEGLEPDELVGCAAGGVIAARLEVQEGKAGGRAGALGVVGPAPPHPHPLRE